MRAVFEVPEAILHGLLDNVALPAMGTLRYELDTPAGIRDVDDAVLAALDASGVRGTIHPGHRVAVGVGSRGIGRLPEIVRALVTALHQWGGDPFIVPVMGSHGGATAKGQRDVLTHLGITEDAVGAPIHSDMSTVVVGETKDGTDVHVDRLAMEADAIVFVARIKPHTAFRGPYESGMAKMLAIGLGKQAGAARTHARGFGEMARMVPEMAEVVLEHAPVRFGIAVLENAHDEPFKIVAMPPRAILPDEPALLDQARAAMPALPVNSLDVLVIDRIGKNISGDGADPNITGRYPTPYASGGPEVSKQVILDLSDASAGNANGVGTADFTTLRLALKMDWGQTYPNALTSTVPGPVALPMVLPSDRLALAAAVQTCNAVGREPRIIRITDTLHLRELRVSAELFEELRRRPDCEVISQPAQVVFDDAGNLRDLAAQ